ncbi:MAG: tRNA lysidine(34) synthetase TilS [Gemmataceae bacterium]|nr:tRNA lysidine(34) synthetase TilS [Gemmataceae bacterium]
MDGVAGEVRRFVRRHGISGPGVVAVSGGADSVALMRALVECGCGPLTVAHLNHRLRGDESNGDEAFVVELAGRLGLAVRTTRIDVAAEAAGENLEATARRLRYARFADVAAEVGASWVATGHTADDQAETVLHRMVRGTGLQGLRGIATAACGFAPTAKPQAAPQVLRPLLTVTRADVVAYLASLNQPFRTDATNADPRFTRNRIRAELLPLLKTFNPEVVSALGQLAEQAEEAFAVQSADAAALLASAEHPRAGGLLVLDAATLSAAHPYRVREALRALWYREAWPTDRMTADHWSRLVGVVRGDLPAADFPAGVTVRRVGRVVQLGRRP